ncbi:hypothetical protein MR818_10235 [bacterium]|nr:hypothetical protein [bacterium]
MSKITSDVLKTRLNITENGRLLINIENVENIGDISWNIKVVYEQRVIYETGYVSNKCIEFQLSEAGRYIIFCQAKIGANILYHERLSKWYYPKEIQTEFLKFYDSYHGENREKLELWALDYPYQNMTLISFRKSADKQISNLNSNIANVGENLNVYLLNETSDWENEVIATFEPVVDGNQEFFFSGKGKSNEHLIIGQDDFENVSDKYAVIDDIGYFSVIYQNKDEIVFTNDYYGMYPLYSYYDNEIKVVSNSYHMLLRVLKTLDVKMTLNVEKIIPYFITGQRMMFEQLASHDTFVRKVHKLTIHKKFKLDLKYEYFLGGGEVDKEIATVLKSNEDLSDVYEELLEKATIETVNNTRIAVEDDRFNLITCDVSGGKDSRTVLGALLNCCKNYEEKIEIHSQELSYTNDKKIFIPLNHLHKLNYKKSSYSVKLRDINQAAKRERSATLGVCFSRGIPYGYMGADTKKQEIKLIGAGEQILRPVFSHAFPNMDYSSISNIVREICKNYNNGSLNIENINIELIDLLTEGLIEIMGNDNYRVFNYHCLYFRNVYHFGLEAMLDSLNNNFEEWAPLYTKTTGRLFQSVCTKYKSMRLQIEMIDKLCPILLKVPFESVDDNREFAEIVAKSNYLDKRFDEIEIRLSDDDTEWNEAQKIYRENRVIQSNDGDDEISKKNTEYYEGIYSDVINKFNRIIHYNNMFNDKLGLDMFIYLTHNKNSFGKNMSKDIVFMCNKINALNDIINILEE